MKIISKFKDFYDYKVAKYGVDEKLVYTRKTYYEYSYSYDIFNRIPEKEFNKNLKDNVSLQKKIIFIKYFLLEKN